jgi:hypothetical protein
MSRPALLPASTRKGGEGTQASSVPRETTGNISPKLLSVPRSVAIFSLSAKSILIPRNPQRR